MHAIQQPSQLWAVMIILATVAMNSMVGARVMHYDLTVDYTTINAASIEVGMCANPLRSSSDAPLRLCGPSSLASLSLSFTHSVNISIPLDCSQAMALVITSRGPSPVMMVYGATEISGKDILIPCDSAHGNDTNDYVTLHGVGMVTYQWIPTGPIITAPQPPIPIPTMLVGTDTLELIGPLYLHYLGCKAILSGHGHRWSQISPSYNAGDLFLGLNTTVILAPITQSIPCLIMSSPCTGMGIIPYIAAESLGTMTLHHQVQCAGIVVPSIIQARLGARQYLAVDYPDPFNSTHHQTVRGPQEGWDRDPIDAGCTLYPGGIESGHVGIPLFFTLDLNIDRKVLHQHLSHLHNIQTITQGNELYYEQFMPWAAHSRAVAMLPGNKYKGIQLLSYGNTPHCSPCSINVAGVLEYADISPSGPPSIPEWVHSAVACLPHTVDNSTSRCITDNDCHSTSLATIKCNPLSHTCMTITRDDDLTVVSCMVAAVPHCNGSGNGEMDCNVTSLLSQYSVPLLMAPTIARVQCDANMEGEVPPLGTYFTGACRIMRTVRDMPLAPIPYPISGRLMYITWYGLTPHYTNQSSQCTLPNGTIIPLYTPSEELPTLPQECSGGDYHYAIPNTPNYEEHRELWTTLATWGRVGDIEGVDWVALVEYITRPSWEDLITIRSNLMEQIYKPLDVFGHLEYECTGSASGSNLTGTTWSRWVASGGGKHRNITESQLGLPGDYNITIYSESPLLVYRTYGSGEYTILVDGANYNDIHYTINGTTTVVPTGPGIEVTILVNSAQPIICGRCAGARPVGATCDEGVYWIGNSTIDGVWAPQLPPPPFDPYVEFNATIIIVPTVIVGNIITTGLVLNDTLNVVGSLTLSEGAIVVIGAALNVTGEIIINDGGHLVISSQNITITASCINTSVDNASIIMNNVTKVNIMLTSGCAWFPPSEPKYEGMVGPCGESPTITASSSSSTTSVTQLTIIATFEDECNILDLGDGSERSTIIIGVTVACVGCIIVVAIIIATVFRKKIFPHRDREYYVPSHGLRNSRAAATVAPPSI